MKIYRKYFLFLIAPHCALLQNTKYEVSNITKTLILASSPFVDLSQVQDSDWQPRQFGYPAEEEEEDSGLPDDLLLVEPSRIHEVRVRAPTEASAVSRRPKSVRSPYFEYENQMTRWEEWEIFRVTI